MIGWLRMALVLLWASTAIQCVPQRAPVVPIVPHEGSLDQWFYSIGIMQYGQTREEVDAILARESYCGKYRFMLEEIEWMPSWNSPPVGGPFYGLYPLDQDGRRENRLLHVLISDHGRMTHVLKSIMAEHAFGLVPLAGSPEVIECMKAAESTDERRFAEYYWQKEQAIVRVLRGMGTLDSAKTEIADSLSDSPQWTWSVERAIKPWQRFRDQAGPESFISCDFESGLGWDEIHAVRLCARYYEYALQEARIPATYEGPTEIGWKSDCLANIYVQRGQIVGVIVRESNFPGCVPEPVGRLNNCGDPGNQLLLYSPYTYHYWRLNKVQSRSAVL